MDSKQKVEALIRARQKIIDRKFFGLCGAIGSCCDISKYPSDKEFQQLYIDFDLLRFKPASVKKDQFWWHHSNIQIRLEIIDELIKQFSE